MYNVAICDDEPKILKDLSDKIKTIFSKMDISVQYFITHEETMLLEYLDTNNIDILFLDIDMPKHNGMEIAELILNKEFKTLLIFVTNQEALVYQSFQYHPFGFIRKNFFNEEIEQLICNAVNKLSKEQATITFKNRNELIRIKISEILYFESDSNYVKMFTTETNYHYRETLSTLEKKLASKGFIRIHKGYLVNQQFVYTIRYEEIELTNGDLLPIGRTNRDSVRKQIMKYMR
jgi:DNA-binding LytR/AlgR family response regulator